MPQILDLMQNIKAMILPLAVLSFVLYILMAYSMFRIYKKANANNAWLAFFPMPFNYIPMMECTRKPAWRILLWLIPFLSIYFTIVDTMDFFDSFGIKKSMAVISIFLPFIFPIILLYMAFSNEVYYEGV